MKSSVQPRIPHFSPNHPASPWLAQQLTQTHRKAGTLPATSNNTNMSAQKWLAGPVRNPVEPQESDSCIDTFMGVFSFVHMCSPERNLLNFIKKFSFI